ncbi:MAG: aminoacyl-tRNA hydrolase [Actinobacteria bacterium]|nr:aminoacyl-tRNA hydrolase [Actinomycetota bacterium]
MVAVTDTLDIPDAELSFTTSRSGGPGGQNVNKVSTRVTLLFDVDHSPSLNDEQRFLVRTRLSGRISREGVLRVIAQRHRTQLANKDDALRRFATLLRMALSEQEARIPVGVPEAVNERRLAAKRLRSRLKQDRSVGFDEDE